MHAIKALWTNGRIVPAEPVDWPEGSELLVEPLAAALAREDSEQADTPEALAAWIAAVESLQPMKWEPGEEEAYERHRTDMRAFNIEAVRRQMEAMSAGEAP